MQSKLLWSSLAATMFATTGLALTEGTVRVLEDVEIVLEANETDGDAEIVLKVETDDGIDRLSVIDPGIVNGSGYRKSSSRLRNLISLVC